MAKRILAVDDEPHILEMVKKRLESAGYEVSTAIEGLQALARAQSEKPDLIVLDLMLPNLNGYEVCARLKADGRYRDIPILMLTARSQEKDVTDAMTVGADCYMTKPYDAQTLLGQVANLLAEAEKRRTTLTGTGPAADTGVQGNAAR